MTVTLLDRLVFSEVGSSFGFGLGLFSVLLVMNHLFYLARLVIGQGLSVTLAIVLMVYKIPYFIAFSVPMGVLLATVWGVGRLADHHEMAALRVAGVSLYRIAAPVVLGGALAALGTLVFAEGVVNLSEQRYRVVLGQARASGTEFHPIENVFFQAPIPNGNALYTARRYDPRTKTLEDVTVVYVVPRHPLEVVEAASAVYAGGTDWAFRNGHVYAFSEGKVVTTTFEALDVRVPRAPEDFTVSPVQPQDLSLRELVTEIRARRRAGEDAWTYVEELHSKIATALSSIVFALVALPLSLRPHRSGPSMGFGLSILVLVAYYLIAIPAQLAADSRALAPVVAAWLPDALVSAAGAILLVRAAR